MKIKRLLAICLGIALLSGCTPKPAPTPAPTPSAASTPVPTATPEPTPSLAEDEKVRIAMLKGPTGLGACKLMEDKQNSTTTEFTVCAEPTEAVALLTKGEADIAALPTNLAATLYHKTDGGIQLLALNTYGVLYILEKGGPSIRTMTDLKGKTVHAYGQGANPEFVLNYLLEQNGVEPEEVDIQWHSSTDEVTALMAEGEAEICMLPVPAATGLLMKKDEVRTALDLTEEWEKIGDNGVLTMGCVVARTEFARQNPEAVDAFLSEYKESIAYMSDPENLTRSSNDNPALLAEKYGIVPKAAVATRALPDANLCFVTGDDMMAGIQGYYQVLAAADPASIGGSIPDGAFYYDYKS